MSKVDYVKFAIYSIAGGAFYFSLGISLDWILGQSTNYNKLAFYSATFVVLAFLAQILKRMHDNREKKHNQKKTNI